MIVDDDPEVVSIFKMRIQDDKDIELVGVANNGNEGVELCLEILPDVVLMDIYMKTSTDGIEATKKIKESNKDIKVIIITSYTQQANISKAMKADCNGFITKDAETDAFIGVIKSVYNGFDVWSSGVDYKMGSVNIQESYAPDELGDLTEQEIFIIKCMTRGMKHSEIAQKLSYSDGYIRQLTSNLYEKVGVKTNMELAVWGARQGL